jgi:hypothetical protein
MGEASATISTQRAACDGAPQERPNPAQTPIRAISRGTPRRPAPRTKAGLVRFIPASGMLSTPMAASDHPLRLRLREVAFILLGVSTSAGLSVLWFGMVPELMARKAIDRGALDGLSALVTHPGFQVPVLMATVLLLAAGTATRLAMGRDRATWILAGGCLLAFSTLALTVQVLYQRLLAG